MAAISKFSVNHNRWKASNAQLLGACEDPTVRHTADDDFAGRISSPTHHLDCVVTQGTARTENFNFSTQGHFDPPMLPIVNILAHLKKLISDGVIFVIICPNHAGSVHPGLSRILLLLRREGRQRAEDCLRPTRSGPTFDGQDAHKG
jgi:hypothetical protein